MHPTPQSVLVRLGLFLASVIGAAVAGLFVLLLIQPAPSGYETFGYSPTAPYESANAVTSGLVTASNELSYSMTHLDTTLVRSRTAISSSASTTSQAVTSAISAASQATGQALASTASLLVRGLSTTSLALAAIPRTTIDTVSDTAIVSAIIEPAKHQAVPQIDTATTLTLETMAPETLPAVQTAAVRAAPVDTSTVWPMHGRVTTHFGAPHWPYQPIHTGIDISDGKRSGITPIRPFKPGRVIAAVHSYRGLGNYVTVDHGSGLTSVYAHLASIHVQTGQTVTKDTVVGYQGSTGTSTGTHLHFEVHEHGVPINPERYISGHP